MQSWCRALPAGGAMGSSCPTTVGHGAPCVATPTHGRPTPPSAAARQPLGSLHFPATPTAASQIANTGLQRVKTCSASPQPNSSMCISSNSSSNSGRSYPTVCYSSPQPTSQATTSAPLLEPPTKAAPHPPSTRPGAAPAAPDTPTSSLSEAIGPLGAWIEERTPAASTATLASNTTIASVSLSSIEDSGGQATGTDTGSGSATDTDAAAQEPLPPRLTATDLQSWVETRGLRAVVVPELPPGSTPPPGCAVVKSIVCMADGKPVVAVVLLEGRLEERKLADLLKVARRRVRLARQDEVVRATGFVVGTVPPFGHKQPLPTYVDVAVTRYARVYGGGGDPDKEIEVAVPDLLSYAAATVADIAAGPAVAAAAAAPSGVSLPLPWARGSEAVSVVAVVAQRRRIAKLLQFVNLVPEEVPGLPRDGQAVYLRKLWRNPDTGGPAEVQLILGKTLERQLGRQAAQELMDQVKVGCVVAITGRVQPHRPPASQQQQGQQGQQEQQREQGQQQGQGGAPPRPDVLDVVCHSLEVLHKSKDHLNKALRAAKRSGLGSPTTALELLMLQRQRGKHTKGGEGTGTGAAAAGSADDASDVDEDAEVEEEEEEEVAGGSVVGAQANGRPGSVSTTTTGSRGDGRANGSAGASGNGLQAGLARGSGGEETGSAVGPEAGGVEGGSGSLTDEAGGLAALGWCMPLPLSAVRWVATAEEVEAMEVEILGTGGEGGKEAGRATLAGAAGGCGGQEGNGVRVEEVEEEAGAGAAGAVLAAVGLDVEWMPYDKGQQRTPVAVMQVATRHTVFLVDMLQLCGGQHQGGDAASRAGAGAGPAGWAAAGAGAAADAPLSAGEAAVSRFLHRLLCSPHVVKLGFQLASDLDRIAESYPRLPCFAPPSPSPPSPSAAADARQAPTSHPAVSTNGADSSSTSPSSGNGNSSSGGGGGGGSSRREGPSPALCVDVMAMARALRPDLSYVAQMSLSRLVERVLGLPLDKAQQRSDWSRRPLSAAQVRYAATDAFVLVALYDRIMGLEGRVSAAGAPDEPMGHLSAQALAAKARVLEVLPPAVKSLVR